MNLCVEITENALKEYREIKEPFKSNIKKKIDNLCELGFADTNIKSLHGEFAGFYRKRIGDFRVIFTIKDNILTIYSVVERKNAYK